MGTARLRPLAGAEQKIWKEESWNRGIGIVAKEVSPENLSNLLIRGGRVKIIWGT